MKPNKKQFLGRWVNWNQTIRVEQELFADGRFEGHCFDEEDGDDECVSAKGTWKVADGAIHWRYTEAHGMPLPKKVDVNPILHIEEHAFSVSESNRRKSDWYRSVKGEDTSANFDTDQVEPLLTKIARLIDDGFGEAETIALVKKLRRLKPDATYQVVFSITFRGKRSPFRIRIIMDDVDAPDIYFYALSPLVRRIEKEIQKIDSERDLP